MNYHLYPQLNFEFASLTPLGFHLIWADLLAHKSLELEDTLRPFLAETWGGKWLVQGPTAGGR